MARAIPRVDDGVLYPVERAADPIRLDAPGWYAWLEDHTSFSFVTPGGAVTVRKERGRPSGWYWKAYRRVAGKVRTAYLGRSADLSLARLQTATTALHSPAPPPASPPSAEPAAFPAAGPEPLLGTKLFMPRPRAHRVLRRRLLDQLRGDPLSPVVLVAAPAGYGKTTLVADWIASDGRAAAWISLDPGDNDPGAFWTAVVTALDRLHPEAGARALQWLHNPQPPPLSGILTILINDLTAHLRPDAAGRPALLILDDYHLITERAIHESVITLIAHLPPHLRLVLTSRADPPLRLGRLRVRGQILEIRTDDLAFDGAETAAFLRETMDLALADDDAAALATRTEGWVAALQLAALSLRSQPDPAAFIAGFSGSHRPLLAYLFDEVVSRQPPAHQDFLLATGVLDQMCAGLCAAVLSSTAPGIGITEADVQALLEELEAANLFVVALDTSGHWYRYHRLFAETLRHRLRQRDPAGERDFRRRASTWYAQAGYGPEAIAQALAGQDWDAAAGLIAHFAEETRQRGELGTVAGWLGALPPPLLHADPRLALLQALLLLFENQYAAVELWLHDVERGLAETPVAGADAGPSPDPLAPAPLHGRIAVVHAQVERALRSDLEQSQAYAQAALVALPADDVEWRTMAMLNLATVAYYRDDLENAVRYYREAGSLSARGSFHLLTCIIGSRGSALLYDLGRLGAARALCAETRRLVAGAAGADLPGVCQIDWAEAVLRYEASDLPGAERLLRQAIVLAAQGRQLELEGFAYVTRSQVCLAQGDFTGALHALEAAAARLAPPQTGAVIYQRMLAAWQATVLLARAAGGDPSAAGPEVAPILPLGEPWTALPDPSIAFAHWLLRPAQLLPARARLAQGDPAGALAYLQDCCAEAEARGARTLLLAALALQAVVLAALGRGAPARTALLRAVTLGADQGHVRSILDAGPGIGPLLHALAADLTRTPGTSPAFLAYVYTLRDAAGGDAPPPAAAAPRGGPGVILSSRELAILRLVEAGCSNQEIAGRLILGVSTVKWYLRAIYEKLGTGNRTQAVARARALRLLP